MDGESSQLASKLAWAGRIERLRPIEKADRILLAEVICGEGGKWSGVVRKGEFSEGDACTVFLQDAVVPKTDSLSFMEAHGWRVKMARFRGAPSECVIIAGTDGAALGDDLTQRLGVVKYSRPVHGSLSGDALGPFPSMIPKTDEPNFQGARWMLHEMEGLAWVATAKMDGMSTTAYRNSDHFGVCSRNLELKPSDSSAQWKIARKYELPERLLDGFAIQWETCGPKIQGNPLGLLDHDGYVFDVYDFRERRYLSHDAARDFLFDTRIAMPVVPTVFNGQPWPDKRIWQPDGDGYLQLLAEGPYPVTGRQREGVVIRPTRETRCERNGSRLSFKVLNLKYTEAADAESPPSGKAV